MSFLIGRYRSPFMYTSPPTVTERKLVVSSTDTALADTDAGSCTKICARAYTCQGESAAAQLSKQRHIVHSVPKKQACVPPPRSAHTDERVRWAHSPSQSAHTPLFTVQFLAPTAWLARGPTCCSSEQDAAYCERQRARVVYDRAASNTQYTAYHHSVSHGKLWGDDDGASERVT
jgi:hypothetical protein